MVTIYIDNKKYKEVDKLIANCIANYLCNHGWRAEPLERLDAIKLFSPTMA